MIDRICQQCNMPFRARPFRVKAGYGKFCSPKCRVKAVTGIARIPLEDRFWARVDRRGPDECWPWTGGKNADGYGSVSIGRKRKLAPRLSWEIANGAPFPADLLACHSCDNPPCVNPAHIWVGTRLDNARDCVNKGRRPKRTHCPQGHEYTPENTYVYRGGRSCKTCGLERTRRRRNELRQRGVERLG